MQNTDHDEAYNRETWTGEAWLGVESMHAPVHAPANHVWRGTYVEPVRHPMHAKEAKVA